MAPTPNDKSVGFKLPIGDYVALKNEGDKLRITESSWFRIACLEKLERDMLGRNRAVKAIDLFLKGMQIEAVADRIGITVIEIQEDVGNLKKLLLYAVMDNNAAKEPG